MSLKLYFIFLLNTLSLAIADALKFYCALLVIRVYLTWFPNFNMYEQPLLTLGKLTNPYLRIFRGIIPVIFGIDISPILAFVFMQFVIDFFKTLKFADPAILS